MQRDEVGEVPLRAIGLLRGEVGDRRPRGRVDR